MTAARLLHQTRSPCPTCFEILPARYSASVDGVRLERECPTHGRFAPLVWTDVAEFERFVKLFPSAATTDSPFIMNQAHACLAVIDVTDKCNLRCAYCFASSGPDLPHKPVSDVLRLLDVVLENGAPIPIQLSGGEPTIREDLLDIIRAARSKGFTHIQINTNGIRLASDVDYAAKLKAAGATAIYLQFDGLEAATHLAIRGADLTRVKSDAVKNCRAAGLSVMLVSTIVPTVNDHEMGAIVRFALDHADIVRGVNFQPVSHFGRHSADTGNLSMDEAAKRIAEQTGFLSRTDFLPIPCCSALCQASALVLRTPAGPVPLTKFVSTDIYQTLTTAIQESDYLEMFAKTERGRA